MEHKQVYKMALLSNTTNKTKWTLLIAKHRNCNVMCLKLWLLLPWAWGDKVDCSIKNIRAWVGWCWWPGEVLMAGVSLALGVGAGRVNGRNSNNLFFLDASHVCPLCLATNCIVGGVVHSFPITICHISIMNTCTLYKSVIYSSNIHNHTCILLINLLRERKPCVTAAFWSFCWRTFLCYARKMFTELIWCWPWIVPLRMSLV